MAKKIVVTSGKGGVGKTTVTANLGRALAAKGKRVALFDVDFGLNNLDVVMGVENKIVYDVSDVLEGRCRIRQALVEDTERKNLFVLPSGGFSCTDEISGQSIKLILENISALFDYILIDCPAGIDSGFHKAVSCADQAIVVTTPHLTSIRDADKAIGVLKSYKLDDIFLIVNRARGDLMIREKMMFPNDIQEILKTRLIGVIPEEDAVFLSSGYCLPSGSESKKSYKMIAENLIGERKKIFDATTKYSGFFGSIRRSIKKSV